MSTEIRTPQGPPWDVDDVADVHAGLFPAEVTADLLARIASDPDGAAILAALDSTVDDLSLLPPLLMPEKYVLRVEAALFAERRTVAATRPIARERLGALLAPGVGGGGQERPRPVPHLPTPRPQTVAGPSAARPMSPRSMPARPAPTVPPRHQPVIPAFLPGVAGPTPNPPRPAPVADLADARERAAARPSTAPVSRPSSGGPTGPARLGSLEAQRRKRRRWTTGVLAAAAVAGIGVITAVALNQPSSTGVAGGQDSARPTNVTQNPGGANPGTVALQLDPNNLAPAVPSIEGVSPSGGLAGLAQFGECLKLNGINGDDVSGATKVSYSGSQAVAIVVKDATDSSKVRVVVVGTTCGTDGDAAKLADTTVTR